MNKTDRSLIEKGHPSDVVLFTREQRMRGLMVLHGMQQHLEGNIQRVLDQHIKAHSAGDIAAWSLCGRLFTAVAEDIWTDTPRAAEIAQDVCHHARLAAIETMYQRRLNADGH